MSAQISQQVLNRIASGNYLLATAGLLTPTADPLSVAQAVLLAHDASELVMAALAASVGATFKDKQKTFLTNYVDVVEEKTPVRIRLFFNDLNEARISFKHFGILPNAQQFHDCVPKARKHLNEACLACLNLSLDEVGLEMLIEDEDARRSYENAKLENRSGRFEEALKSLGLCFRQVLDVTPFAYYVHVGEADTEAALHLLGCGVDPSMFLSLQGFLPSMSWNETMSEARWNLRGTGHPGNWTSENVEYCLEVTLKIILQIQHAPFRPHAIPFEYVFEDVLTAKTDGVVLNSERGGIYRALFGSGPSLRKVVGELNQGQQISGRVTPAYEFDSSGKWEKTDWDTANVFVVAQPKGETLTPLEPDTDLLIRSDLVDLSCRVADHPSAREKYPHLFSDAGAEEST